MRRVAGFEASHIPRYAGEEAAGRAVDNFLRQRTFWTAVQELLYAAGGGEHSVEIRFTAEPEDRRIRLGLNVHSTADDEAGEAGRRMLEALGRVLPADYAWRALKDGSSAFASDGRLIPPRWFVTKIERRLNFIDLPWRSLETVDLSGAPGGGQDNPTVQDFRSRGPRRLITNPLTRGEVLAERFCLPMIGPIEPDQRNLRLLFQEVQREAPCIISIAVAPVQRERVDAYRRVSTFWADFLEPFGRQVANAGLGHYATLRALHDRFMLPDRYLLSSTLRVAAPTEAAAMAVAVHLSARLGGLRAFSLRPPGWHAASGPAATRTSDLPLIGDPYVDIPNAAWSRDKLARRRSLMRSGLEEAGIEPDLEPLFLDFLMELPYLYTIDEIAAVASLPFADDAGLPGFDTRPVAPFTEPSRGPPDTGRLPPGRIRIGRSQGGLDGTKAGPAADDWHTLPSSDLTKHAFVVGSTGSGKTITTLFLVRELARLGVPFLIIEPVKTEYYDHLKDLEGHPVQRRRFEGSADGRKAADFLAFDPMRLQSGVSVARHASYLKSCFEAAFPIDADSAEAMILEAGIRSYYTTPSRQFGCGLGMFDRGGPEAHSRQTVLDIEQAQPPDAAGRRPPPKRFRIREEAYRASATLQERVVTTEEIVHPSLHGLRRYFSWTFLPQITSQGGAGKQAELLATWQQFFERRFEALSHGMIGIAARAADEAYLEDPSRFDLFDELVRTPTILELDGIPDGEQKALMMAFVMAFLFERRQADDLRRREAGEGAGGDRLKHVLVVEEAHRVLAAAPAGRAEGGAQSRSVSLFVDMLAEIRAFGQGIIIVEQIPTKIVPEAVKNTNLKIMLRLTASDDREFLGSAMNFTDEQKRFVTSLRAEPGRGVDMVVFEQQLDQPRLLTLPLPDRREDVIHQALFEKHQP